MSPQDAHPVGAADVGAVLTLQRLDRNLMVHVCILRRLSHPAYGAEEHAVSGGRSMVVDAAQYVWRAADLCISSCSCVTAAAHSSFFSSMPSRTPLHMNCTWSW